MNKKTPGHLYGNSRRATLTALGLLILALGAGILGIYLTINPI